MLKGAIGDVVRGFAVLAPLKRHFPDCTIGWVVEPLCEPLVRSHPLIDNVHLFRREQGFWGYLELCRILRQQRFDLTLDLQRHLKSGGLSLATAAPRRIGFHRRNAKEFNWLFNNQQIPFFSDELSKLQHYLKFLEYLGVPTDNQIDFGLAELRPNEGSKQLLTELGGSYVGVVLGSTWESKNWLVDGYIGLVKKIIANGYRAVLLGTSEDSAAAQEIQSCVAPPSGLVNLVGRTALLDLLFVLGGAQANVGPDSGPGHMSAAMNVPYVSIFGPTSPKRVAPYGSEHLVLHANLGCVPCYRRKCPGLGKLCMRLINAEKVWEKLLAVLTRKSTASYNTLG